MLGLVHHKAAARPKRVVVIFQAVKEGSLAVLANRQLLVTFLLHSDLLMLCVLSIAHLYFTFNYRTSLNGIGLRI